MLMVGPFSALAIFAKRLNEFPFREQASCARNRYTLSIHTFAAASVVWRFVGGPGGCNIHLWKSAGVGAMAVATYMCGDLLGVLSVATYICGDLLGVGGWLLQHTFVEISWGSWRLQHTCVEICWGWGGWLLQHTFVEIC